VDDLAKLQIRVESLEVATAEKRLKGLEKQGGKTERATDGLTSGFKRVIGPAALLAAAVAGLSKTVSVAREFDVLNAQLITATGNSENAAIAFDAIQQFAADTPYDLQQVTKGFTQLVNLGLTPSERALTSYGDTASAMGKGLGQLVEAVADATTGEFERLKEFGIKTKSEGDNVSFTFRGITTTVKKNAEEIEGYLIGLGENNFAGAMANRMNTLDGALSNLGDEWDKLWLNISKQGIGSVVEDSVRVAIDIVGELNDILASGEMEGYLDVIALKFSVFGDAVDTALNAVYDSWNAVFSTSEGQGLGKAVTDTIDFVVDALFNLPENVKAVVQIMAVEFGAFTQYGSIHGAAYGELLLIEFDRILAKAGVVGEGIAAALNPFDEGDFDFTGALDKADQASDKLAADVDARVAVRLAANAEVRKDAIQGIFDQREAALKAVDDEITATEKLREAYDIKQKQSKADTTDKLAPFGIEKPKKKDDEPDKAAIKAQEAREKEFARLVDSLRSEEEVIADSYSRRLAIILDNTEASSQQQANLKQKLNDEYATDILGDLAPPDTYDEQLEKLQEFYEKRRQLVLDNTALTEEQRLELLATLGAEANERTLQLETERNAILLTQGEQMFTGLSELAKTYGGEQSKAYKALFATSQAFSVAKATMNMYTGISEGVKLGWPAMIPAIALAAGQGAMAISNIRGQSFSGAYDTGGDIPSGSFGLVGEVGAELIKGPATVTSRKDTQEMFKKGGGGTTIINLMDQSQLRSLVAKEMANNNKVIVNSINEEQRSRRM